MLHGAVTYSLRVFYLVIALLWLSTTANCLTAEERSELARKFKYYHASVRPGDRYNLVETVNGTFFGLHTEVAVSSTRPTKDSLELELLLAIHYSDERLILRDLSGTILVPDEFDAWIPTLDYPNGAEVRNSFYIDPKTGQINLNVKVNTKADCSTEMWTTPFNTYLLTRDVRTDEQVRAVYCTIAEWPFFLLHCKFRSEWMSVLVNTYFPSFLLFAVVVFAQWKRRKLQVTVTLAGIIALIIMHHSRPSASVFTMHDLWFISTFMHMISVLLIDLLLPVRRIIKTVYSSNGDSSGNVSTGGLFPSRAPKATVVSAYTTSNRDAQQHLYRPFTSLKTIGFSADESLGFVDRTQALTFDYEESEEQDRDAEECEDDEKMRTTFVHVDITPTPPTPSTRARHFSTRSTSYLNTPSPAMRRFGTAAAPISASTALNMPADRNKASRSRTIVTEMGIGRKKRLCLLCIVICYAVFFALYFTMVLYIVG